MRFTITLGRKPLITSMVHNGLDSAAAEICVAKSNVNNLLLVILGTELTIEARFGQISAKTHLQVSYSTAGISRQALLPPPSL